MLGKIITCLMWKLVLEVGYCLRHGAVVLPETWGSGFKFHQHIVKGQ